VASSSYWQSRRAPDDPAPAAELPRSCAVVVIGGGVIGVSCAHALAGRGLDVLLLEAGGLATCASGRNGGFVVGSPRELERLWAVLEVERIECGYTESGHLALAAAPTVLERFREEALRRGGAVEVLDPPACEDIIGQPVPRRFYGGRWQPRAALLDPVRLVAGLARAAVRRGATLLTPCTALRLTGRDDGAVAVDTDRGRVECRHAVVACGIRTGALVPELAGLLRPVVGRMLASEPGLERRVRVGMAVDFGTTYWRQEADGTVIIGGREPLERFLATAFGGWPVLRPRVRWSGVMDETPDGAPLLGRASKPANVWVAAGFGGHGIPPALDAGEAIARAIADNRPPAALERLAPARLMEVAAA
jgi:gamma-glutamylputrescine oxidase